MANNIQRWDPWTEAVTLREAMGRLLEDSFVRPNNVATGQSVRALELDVFENEEGFEVTACLPGLKPEDVEITVQGEMLMIKGQHKAQSERKNGSYLVRESRAGSVFRRVQLPVMVDADKAEARFENGMLHLRLPKAESTKPRSIRIGNSPSRPAIEAEKVETNAGSQSRQENGAQAS